VFGESDVWSQVNGQEEHKEVMNMLGLQDAVGELEKANRVRCYGDVFRGVEDDVPRRALDFKVNGRRGRTRKKWKRRVKKTIRKIGQSQEDALPRLK